MKDTRSGRRIRRARLAQREGGRIPRAPGRTLDPERRLRGLVDLEPDLAPSAKAGLVSDLADRLGPKGRFLVAAIIISTAITVVTMTWEKYVSSTAASADHTDPAQVGLGHTLYDQHCAYCHATDLTGKADWDGDYPKGGRPPLPLDGSAPIWRLSDRDIFNVAKFGGQVYSPAFYRNEMPAFEDQLADAEIWAIVAFVKSRWTEDVRQRQREAAEQPEG